MSPATGSRALCILAAACLGGCFGSFARSVEDTRAGLLGLDGRELRACLGVPTDFEIDGDLEHQTYRFEGHDPFDDEGVRAGGIGGVVILDQPPSDRRHDRSGFPIEDASYCQLDFELTRGRVSSVLAQGRTREGMNADGSCMLRARHCVRYVDEDEPSE